MIRDPNLQFGFTLIAILIIGLIIAIWIGACTTRKAPGDWDANLRYTLTHPECQNATNIFGNC
jgi:hypothetical protein